MIQIHRTSDTVLAFATGESGNAIESHQLDFQVALDDVMLGLAHQIVRDGEGATKFIEITVTGAEDDAAAKAIAKSCRIHRSLKLQSQLKTLIGEESLWLSARLEN